MALGETISKALGVATLLMVAYSCGRAGAQLDPQPLGPTDAPGYIAPSIAAKAVDFRGTCSWARAPGASESYRIRLRARPSPSGTVLVRASAVFDLTDRSNLLGELPSGATAMGDGPVYDSQTQRRGYAILVRGTTGRVCRGYVSESSVSVD